MSRKSLVLVLLTFAVSCSSSAGGSSGPSPAASCKADSECPSGQGCYTTQGTPDGYCTKLCTVNEDCPAEQFDCPSLAKFTEADCRQSPNHGGKGVCQIYDNSLGPNTCRAAPAK